MCKGSALITVDCDGVEGACGGREVLPVSLLMRPRSDRSRSCKRVTVMIGMYHDRLVRFQGVSDVAMGLCCTRDSQARFAIFGLGL